jgi:hypothetical protein
MTTEHIATSARAAYSAASDARLHTVFPKGSLVWIVDEQYDPNGPVWQVDLVYQGAAGRWLSRRYRYDIPSDTLYFTGERPLAEGELAAARRCGRRL